jgi:hypothetical protein
MFCQVRTTYIGIDGAKEHAMRAWIAGLLACFGLVLAGPAGAETWYLRNSGDGAGKGVAAPLSYCLRGIAAGGGVCAGPNYQPGEQNRERQSTRRPERDRCDRWD